MTDKEKETPISQRMLNNKKDEIIKSESDDYSYLMSLATQLIAADKEIFMEQMKDVSIDKLKHLLVEDGATPKEIDDIMKKRDEFIVEKDEFKIEKINTKMPIIPKRFEEPEDLIEMPEDQYIKLMKSMTDEEFDAKIKHWWNEKDIGRAKSKRVTRLLKFKPDRI